MREIRDEGQGVGRAATDDATSAPDHRDEASDKRRGSRQLSATQRALGLLTRREHSRKELAHKLISRGLEVNEVSAVIEKLAEVGWQNDRRFAESLVRSRAQSGYGPLHIRAELSTHGLSSDAIVDALASVEGDWHERACELVRRRYACSDPTLKTQRKAANFLIRRGFDADCVRAATRVDAITADPD